MSYFAKVENGIVRQVIVAEDEFIDAQPGTWVQTYKDGTRKNYAGIGYTYDSVRDAFIPPKPYPSWTLVESSCNWQAPIPVPIDGNNYVWNELTLSWEIA